MTPPVSELLKLAERCEAATGLDRELDQCIHEIVVIGLSELTERAYPHCERYTASVDAAMQLAPEGWTVDLVTLLPPQRSTVRLYGPSGQVGDISYGATPALALCAAALRARTALESR